MAKSKSLSKKQHDTATAITTPSPYGSHASMVVDHTKFDLTLEENEVLCKDDTHYYVTKRDRLDNGLADHNRHALSKTVEVTDGKSSGSV